MPGQIKPIQSTTQQHLDIEDIVDNLIILKDGSASMVITTTSVNFGLLSEAEQDATIYAYAALLNSLTFAIQILIRSKRKDITGYERLLEEQEAKATKPENKDRIRRYREFIQETVRQRNVLDKKFYIIIPFFVLELGVTQSAATLAKGKRSGLPYPKEYIVQRSKMTLDPKRDHVIHQLSRLGLRSRQLTTKELIQLMFEIYNPESSQGQLLAAPEEYETPLVQPAVAFQHSPQEEVPQEVKPLEVPLSQPTAKPSATQSPQPPSPAAVPSEQPTLSAPPSQSPEPENAPEGTNDTLKAQEAIDKAVGNPPQKKQPLDINNQTLNLEH